MAQLVQKFGPHLRTKRSTQSIMRDVCIALMPALVGSVYFFGGKTLLITLTSVLTCVLSEALWELIHKRELTIKDLSAVVTGLLLAFNMPVTVPLWVVAAAAIFAIVIVKQMFGGIGSNFVNPALMGRLFIMIVWPGKIMHYVATNHAAVDTMTSATILNAAKHGTERVYSAWDMFIGNIPGALGETSKLLLLIGFAYMCYRGIVNVSVAASYVLTVVVLTFVIGPNGLFTGDIVANLFGGGLILGACFMLTDYTFASSRGRVLFGVTAGIITAIIRIWGGYPEGVCFGIVVANCLAGLLDTLQKRHVYGVNRKKTEE